MRQAIKRYIVTKTRIRTKREKQGSVVPTSLKRENKKELKPLNVGQRGLDERKSGPITLESRRILRSKFLCDRSRRK